MISICRTYRLEAAHFLPLHEGKCHRLHGHSYIVEVEVVRLTRNGVVNTGPEMGMVVDFERLDQAVNPHIQMLDHQVINEVLPSVYPTAENLASYLFGAIELPQDIQMQRVRVWETARSWAEVRR